MEIAHQEGMKTSVTMMYGIGETLAERIEHFAARPRGAGADERLHGVHLLAAPAGEHADDVAHAEDRRGRYLRTVAIARIVLDNVPNLQASWVTMGMKIGQTALRFGCNDFGSLMIEENVVSAANTTHRTTTDEIERLIRDAGFKVARRRQDYYDHRGACTAAAQPRRRSPTVLATSSRRHRLRLASLRAAGAADPRRRSHSERRASRGPFRR